MEGTPSAAAWIALAALWVAMATSYFVSTRSAAERSGGEQSRLLYTATAAASAPVVISVVLEADLQTKLWWALLVVPATSVLVLVAIMSAGFVRAWRRERWRAIPEERTAAVTIAGLAVVLTLSLPAGVLAVALLDADVRTTTAVALLVADATWEAMRLRVRRWPVPV